MEGGLQDDGPGVGVDGGAGRVARPGDGGAAVVQILGMPAAARKSARARARGTASLSEEHSLAKGGFGAILLGCLSGGGEAAGGFDGQRYSEEVEVGEQVSERRTGGAMSEVGCVDNDDRLEVTRAERVVILIAKIGQMGFRQFFSKSALGQHLRSDIARYWEGLTKVKQALNYAMQWSWQR